MAAQMLFTITTWLVLMDLARGSIQAGAARESKMYTCLQNCAYCVQFWEYGLYNGRRCAKRCLRQQGREVVDPDCNDPKMFNYSSRIIDLLLKMQNPADGGHETDDAIADDDLSVETTTDNSVRRRRAPAFGTETVTIPARRPVLNHHGTWNARHDEVSEQYRVEFKAQHHRRAKQSRGPANLLFTTTTSTPKPYEHHHPPMRHRVSTGHNNNNNNNNVAWRQKRLQHDTRRHAS